MLFLVKNRTLVENREKTYLTAAVSAAGTTLTVKAVDTNAWADNDWIIVGEIGAANAEILQINGAVSDGTSLTIDNAGSGGARYAHSVDEPVYRIPYNQMKLYHGTTTTDSDSSLLTTVEIQPDDYFSRYEDTANTTGYGFVRLYNSHSTAISPYSGPMPYTGITSQSLRYMVDKVRTQTDEKDDDFLTDKEIVDALNDKQREIINERLWTFNEIERSTPSIANQFKYDIPSTIKTLHTVRFGTEPLTKLSQSQWESVHWDTDQTTTDPTHVSIWDNDIKIYPRPSSSANSSTLNGAINSSVTSFIVDDASGFTRGDFYRFTIDSEVIYATSVSTNTFSGCLRGQEGTTAASHLDEATVTENDIVYTGQAYATDLSKPNDETVIPESLIICYGVSADFCYGKLDKPTIGDRFEAKYQAGMKSLREKFSRKLTSQFGRVKTREEILNNYLQNPNNYPTNIEDA